MDKKSLAHLTRPYTRELSVLKERYRYEIMDNEESRLFFKQIKRIRKQLKLA